MKVNKYSYNSGNNLSGIASHSAMRISFVLRCKFLLKSKYLRRISHGCFEWKFYFLNNAHIRVTLYNFSM